MLAASIPVSGQSPGSCGDSAPPSYPKDVAGSPAICHTHTRRRGRGLRMESRSAQPPWAWREHTPWTPVTAPLPEASRTAPRASWAPSLGLSHQLLLKIRVSKCLMD